MNNDNRLPKHYKTNKEKGRFYRYFGLGEQAIAEKEFLAKYPKTQGDDSEYEMLSPGENYFHPNSVFIDVLATLEKFDLLAGEYEPDDDRMNHYMHLIMETIQDEDDPLLDEDDLVLGTVEDLRAMKVHEDIEVNVWGYASLMINNLLNPDNVTKDDCAYIKNFMGELIFAVRPTLLAEAYIDQVIKNRYVDQLDELCLLLVDGLERRVDYAITLEEDPLF